MPVIDETVVIARPPGEVFGFLMRAENLPRWDSSMLECVQVGDEAVTVGTRYRLEAESGLDGAFGRAMEPIVQRAQTKVVRANLGVLASLLEQRAA
jgi:uncharacterized protein YndB with AHSA1/START domain